MMLIIVLAQMFQWLVGSLILAKNLPPILLYSIYAILACLNVLLPIKICLKKKIIRPVRSQRGKLLILIDNLNNVNFEAYFFFYFCVILLVSPSA